MHGQTEGIRPLDSVHAGGRLGVAPIAANRQW